MRVASGNSLLEPMSVNLFRQGRSFARKMTENHHTGAKCFQAKLAG